MRKIVYIFVVFAASLAQAQLWSPILSPVDTSPCSGTLPTQCAPGVDVWKTAGVVGGIPVGTQSGSTITAASCSNGASDCKSTIQTALNSCGGTSSAEKYVALGAGTFSLSGPLTVPSYCYLTGAGANSTIIQVNQTSAASVPGTAGAFQIGSIPIGDPPTTNPTISGSPTAGSTTITVSSVSGISVGTMLYITELNDPSIYVTDVGGEGICMFCDFWNGARVLSQLSQVTAINASGCGSTCLTINPGLFRDLPSGNTPYASPYTASTQFAGVENLQIQDYGNQNESKDDIDLQGNNDWATGVEIAWTSADFIEMNACWHCEVDDSYFSNTYNHVAGSYDSAAVNFRFFTTASKVENNICERTHDCFIFERGGGGNVLAYNFCNGNFTDNGDASDPVSPNVCISNHGAHPQFNLMEGNIGVEMEDDSIWGSSSMNTAFRDWFLAAQMGCFPLSASAGIAGSHPTINCTPMANWTSSTSPTAGSWWEFDLPAGFAINFDATSWNAIGSVLGSQDMTGLTQGCGSCTSISTSPAAISVTPTGGCPTGFSCGNVRSYNNLAYSITLGFYETNSGTGSACGTTMPYSTTPCNGVLAYDTFFEHGVYTTPNSTLNWAAGVTHTLPPSFYLTSAVQTSAATPCGSGTAWNKNPTLGTCLPFPPVGPDLWTGGVADSYGYAYMNPAMNCYFNVMGGAWGGPGTPLTFNPSACYAADPAGASFTATPTTIPAHHSNNIAVTLTGTGTSWTGSTAFSISGVSGATLVSKSNSSATSETLQITTGSGTGTLTITDTTDSLTTTISVATATLSISPTTGNISTTPTLTLTGTNTLWLSETASGLFTVSGGTGSSIGTPTVTSNTSATAVLTTGSVTATETITDTSTTATATFSVASPTTPTVTSGTVSSTGMTTASIVSSSWSCTGSCTSVTSEGVCYAITANPTTPCTSDGTTSPFNSSLSSLTAATLYHYRAFATNSAGTAYGSDTTFTTNGVGAITYLSSSGCSVKGSGTGSSNSFSWSCTPANTGDAILFQVTCNPSSGTISGTTLTASGWTITQLFSATGTGAGMTSGLYGAIAPNTSAATFTATFNGVSNCSLFGAYDGGEFSGNNRSGGTATFESTAASGALTGSCSTAAAALTPVSNNDGLWESCQSSATGAVSPWTAGVSNSALIAEYQILSGGAGSSYTPAYTGGTYYVVQGAAIAPAQTSQVPAAAFSLHDLGIR